MDSFGVVKAQAQSKIALVTLLLITLVVALAPALVSAAQATERSITLSSSSKSATGVSYKVAFTPVANAGAFVIDFCKNTPLLGQTCDAPTGFNAASAASTTSGFTGVTGSTSKITVVGSMTAGTPVSVDITGITNPSTTDPLYARIVTYANGTDAGFYTSTDPDNGGANNHIDDGSVAIAITDTIGVAGAVLESMTFCVAGGTVEIPENCNSGGALAAPTLKLGKDTGGVIALDSADVYEGTIYTQISTNAASGAVVNLKSNATGCGGLVRAGAASNAAGCGIAPALTGDIANGEAKFGVKTGTAAGVGTGFNGTLQPYGTPSAYYSDSAYKFNYVSGDATGVTSTYGDPFLDTAGAPVNNVGMPITFGASVSNNTPAGLYSAQLSMVATGKF